jgi:ArsR family transcriptional regulator
LCYNFICMGREKTFDSELFFSALADRTRLRILNLMRDGEVCVCFFAGALETNNPKISRHLSYLKRASLVAGRRDGKWMHYRLQKPTDPKAAGVFDAAMRLLESDAEMVEDRKKLVNICCSPGAPVLIQGRAK